MALLRVSFKDEASTRSGYNAALSYTLGNALKGIAPNFEIDYTKVLISSGNLNAAMNPDATSTQAGKIDFTWDNNPWDFGAETTDLVVLVAYCPLLGKALSVIGMQPVLREARR